MKKRRPFSWQGCLAWVIVLVLLVAGPGTVRCLQGEELPGRLFFTPKERKVLQSLRFQGKEPQGENHQPSGSEKSTVQEIFLRGVVWGAGGRPSVWLENPARPGISLTDEAELQVLEAGDREMLVLLPGNSVEQALRPGQILNQATGQVRELYQGLRPVRAKTGEEDGGDGQQMR